MRLRPTRTRAAMLCPVSALDVVVPVHGAWPHVERCLAALGADSSPHATYVVDDASPDGTGALVSSRFPAVSLMRNPSNLGYARSVNRGVGAGEGEIVVVLNSD